MTAVGTPARVVKPKSVPTAVTAAERTALQALAETQLADTRKAAENWRTGLASLLALITTVSLVKGRDSFDKYDESGQTVLVLVLAATLLCAAIGAYYALLAAYGEPGEVRTADIDTAGGMAAWNMNRAARAASDLRWARWLTFASLVGLAGGVGTTWLAHKPAVKPPASVRVEVSSKAEGVCGELLRFDEGTLKIKVDSEHSPTLQLTDVTSLAVVASCDDDKGEG